MKFSSSNSNILRPTSAAKWPAGQNVVSPTVATTDSTAKVVVSDTPPLTGESSVSNSFDQHDVAQVLVSLRNAKVMIIDDEELVIRVVRRFLTADGYHNFIGITNSRTAIECIDRENPDVVLIDINMPHISGLDLLKSRQESGRFGLIPFIVLSANSDREVKQEALKLGATDFLGKPVDPNDLIARVQNSLTIKRHFDMLSSQAEKLEQQVRERTQMLERSREQIIHCLARAAEFRDNETGEHVIRVGKFSAVIAEELGFDNDYCRKIELAAQLHDVGKIGIPDSILLNPGKLTGEEFDIMKTHCSLGTNIMKPLADDEEERVRQHSTIGASIIDGTDSPMLQMAVEITRSHHEKWDGTGYPLGIREENIPIAGRIVCVADVFDALASERPYKPKFSFKKCLEIMISERGTRFDPRVLDAFFKRLPDIERIRRDFQDGSRLTETNSA